MRAGVGWSFVSCPYVRKWVLNLPDPVLAQLPLNTLVERFRRFTRVNLGFCPLYAVVLQQVLKVRWLGVRVITGFRC